MAGPKFAELVKKDPREFWPDEAADFTPWLASDENLPLIGKALGLELELQLVEQPVGPYRADIVCRSLGDEHSVVIENQLEKTDHDHLGKLITYAAGLDDVSTVVWIAPNFTDEHRAALDWLNRHTHEDVRFFGVSIEVWQIADSLPAPRFTLVSQPNDWSKTQPRSGLTAGQETQLAFWTRFREYADNNGTHLNVGKPQPQNWTSFGIGRTGIELAGTAAKGDPVGLKLHDHIRVEIITRGAKGEAFFDQLEAQQAEIESSLETSLTWARPTVGHQCRIYVSRDAEVTDRDDWPGQHAWLLSWLEKFDAVFRPMVKELQV